MIVRHGMIKQSQFSLLAVLCLLGMLFMQGQANAEQVKEFKVHASDLSRMATSFYNEEDVNLFIREPFFKQVKFIKLAPILSRRERVERILYGIHTDIPPEYDYYGYEIRRYMALTGNIDIFSSPDSIELELKNIENAGIVLDFWAKELKQEMIEIEKILKEKREASSLVRVFGYNRGVANAFFIECQNWIKANKLSLEFLKKIGPKLYKYNAKSVVTFKNKEDMEEFSAIHKTKVDALKNIREYRPFRMMVY